MGAMKRKKPAPSKRSLINALLSGKMGKRYEGKHVVVIGGKAHILPFEGEKSAEIIERLEKKYPRQTPHLVFVPREETYILICH